MSKFRDIEAHLLATRTLISDLVSASDLDERLKDTLGDRLTIRNRFWPSELFLRVAGTFGGGDENQYPAISAAIECLHISTLVQDDIIDGHVARWGKPSLMVLLGTGPALLCSDWLSSQAVRLLADLPAPGSLCTKLLRALGRRSADIAQGQLLDLEYETLETIGMNEYVQLARLKTSVGVMASEMGALFSGASRYDSTLVEEFSAHAGVCSQIANDVSEIFGTRGFRAPYRQNYRGQNELVLGRKTIFHVACHGRKSSQSLANALRGEASPSNLRDWLIREGALAFAEQAYRDFAERAMRCADTISIDVTMLKQYLETANPLYTE